MTATDLLLQLIDALLKAGNYSTASGHPAGLSLEVLRQNPSGLDLGALKPTLPERLLTEDGKKLKLSEK